MGPEKAGGYPDFTLSVWSIDMFRWMFESEIATIEWISNYPKFEKFGGIIGYNTIGLMRLSNGIVGSLHYSASVAPSAGTSRFEVYGDNTFVLHGIWNNKIILYGSDPNPQEWGLPVKGTWVWGHRQIDEHFIDCLINSKKPQVTADDAIKAQETAQKITSNIRRKWLTFRDYF